MDYLLSNINTVSVGLVLENWEKWAGSPKFSKVLWKYRKSIDSDLLRTIVRNIEIRQDDASALYYLLKLQAYTDEPQDTVPLDTLLKLPPQYILPILNATRTESEMLELTPELEEALEGVHPALLATNSDLLIENVIGWDRLSLVGPIKLATDHLFKSTSDYEPDTATLSQFIGVAMRNSNCNLLQIANYFESYVDVLSEEG
jgi:hypothetical protein